MNWPSTVLVVSVCVCVCWCGCAYTTVISKIKTQCEPSSVLSAAAAAMTTTTKRNVMRFIVIAWANKIMHINYSQMFTLDVCGFVDVIDRMCCLRKYLHSKRQETEGSEHGVASKRFIAFATHRLPWRARNERGAIAIDRAKVHQIRCRPMAACAIRVTSLLIL